MSKETIGFIGLGVMGGPMCRNVATKHGGGVLASDLSQVALSALTDTKAMAVSLEELAKSSDVVCLSLLGGPQVEAVCKRLVEAGLRTGSIIIDLSTTPVASAREVGAMLAGYGIEFADAPVARTREAAQRGELSIMVGASPDNFARIGPYLRYMATDITHGGAIGTGQVLKLVNNMLVFENVVTIAEMLVLGESAGVDPTVLLEAVSKGSGDSFALRNHALKSMLPRKFPDKAFPPEYVLKDISYVFELAEQVGVPLHAAAVVKQYYEKAIEQGFGGEYFPGVIRVVEAGCKGERE